MCLVIRKQRRRLRHHGCSYELLIHMLSSMGESEINYISKSEAVGVEIGDTGRI